MIDAAAGRLAVTVPMTLANARGLLDAGRAALQAGDNVFDLSAVSDADSSALAVMLGWLREAGTRRARVRFAQVPTGVRALADLYGLTEHLPLA